MKLPLRLRNKPEYDCIDNLYIGVAEYWNNDYEIMSIDAWGFDYIKRDKYHKEILGKRISTSVRTRIDYLEKYHKIKVKEFYENDFYKAYEKIKMDIQLGRTVAIYMDTFWCPWDITNFQNAHKDHYCLVVGVNEKNGNFYIVDAQFAPDGAELPLNYFKKSLSDYLTFEKIEGKEENLQWKELIEDSIMNFKSNSVGKDVFQKMREFSEELSSSLNFSEEIKGWENMPFSAPLFQELHQISRRRKQYSRALKYIGDRCKIPELIEIGSQFWVVGKKWTSLFGLLCKCYYMNGDKQLLTRCSQRIVEVSEIEERLMSDLINICRLEEKNNLISYEISSTEHCNDKISKYKYVDTSRYLNNKGFGKVSNLENEAELSNEGKFFVLENLPVDEIWKVDNMEFKVNLNKDQIEDNIECEGQVIQINSQGYNNLMILGCSELGSHSEKIEVYYENGEKEVLPLEFSNWTEDEPSYGEIKVWCGEIAQRNNNQIRKYPFKGYLYGKNLKLKVKAGIRALKLPYCPNLHIFSISLGAS